MTTLSVVSLWALQRHSLLALHSSDQRMSIYATVASAAAIVAGFGTAAVGQYASSSGRRMTMLRQLYGIHLRNNWVGVLSAMLTVTGGCLAIMLSDSEKAIGWQGWVFDVLVMLGVFRSIRLIWLFRLLIDVADHDAGTDTSDTRMEVRRIRRDATETRS